MKRISLLVSIVAMSAVVLALLAPPRPAASQSSASSRPAVPAYSHGSLDAITVYLDFGDRLAGGGTAISDAEVYTIFCRVAEKLYPTIGATVTTIPPDLRPGEYVTVRFLSTYTIPWRTGSVGNCPRKMVLNTSYYVPNVVYVGLMLPDRAGPVAAHEVVHCLQPGGYSHEETPVGNFPNLMHPTAPSNGVLSPAMILAVTHNVAELQAGWRMGPFLPPGGGQWRFDWHNIGE